MQIMPSTVPKEKDPNPAQIEDIDNQPGKKHKF